MIRTLNDIRVYVDHYGVTMPLNQLANTKYYDLDNNVVISPWDHTTIICIRRTLISSGITLEIKDRSIVIPLNKNKLILDILKEAQCPACHHTVYIGVDNIPPLYAVCEECDEDLVYMTELNGYGII